MCTQCLIINYFKLSAMINVNLNFSFILIIHFLFPSFSFLFFLPFPLLLCGRSGHISKHCPRRSIFAERQLRHAKLQSSFNNLAPAPAPAFSLPRHGRCLAPSRSLLHLPHLRSFAPWSVAVLSEAHPAGTANSTLKTGRAGRLQGFLTSPATLAGGLGWWRGLCWLLRKPGRGGITEEGPLGVASREEISEIVCHHFGLLRYELRILRSNPEPFIIIFTDRAARDTVFARGRVSDGPVDLRFHSWSWEIDRFGERDFIPYHVKISLEGIPHHAWYQDVAGKILGDAVVIHHVDQATRRREDLRFYVCWAFSHNPSRIPQLVFLTLSDAPGDPRVDAQLSFTRPRNVKRGQVFKVLIHVDSAEDLTSYHQPPEQLAAEGKVQFRELRWTPGRPDGELDEEDVSHPVTRYCRAEEGPRYRPRDDDEEDRSRAVLEEGNCWAVSLDGFPTKGGTVLLTPFVARLEGFTGASLLAGAVLPSAPLLPPTGMLLHLQKGGPCTSSGWRRDKTRKTLASPTLTRVLRAIQNPT
jgi:hypothetical protein